MTHLESTGDMMKLEINIYISNIILFSEGKAMNAYWGNTAAKCVWNILSQNSLSYCSLIPLLVIMLWFWMLVQNPVIRPEKVENLSLRSPGPIWIKVVS